MTLTRDFHPSQVLWVDKTQRYSLWGEIACSFCSCSLVVALILSNNGYGRLVIYFNQIVLGAVTYKFSRLKRITSVPTISSYEVANQGFEAHLQASYAPPKREVQVIAPESAKPLLSHPVIKALYEQKLECNLVDELKSPSFVRTMVKPINCTASKVLGIGKELQLDLALDSPPIMSISKGAIAIDTPRSDRQIARFTDYWKPSQKIEAAIGVDINNKLVSIDLSHPETCHILAAGTTGSGKSVWLQSLLLSLLIGRSPEELQVVICDPKQVSFFAFKNCANLLTPIISSPDEVIQIGNWLISQMENRYKCFAEYEVENIDQYNSKVSKSEQLPRILFLMDEYGDLKSACNKKQSDEIEAINIRIGEKARASGISQAIITQRALKVITPRIRANCPARVLLKVAEKGDTECILGDVSYDGRDLLGRGDLFFNGDRLQSLLCESSDFAKLNKGEPVYQLEDLASISADTSNSSIPSKKVATDSQITAPVLKAIINFLDGRDWQRDNYIKQSVRLLKERDEPIETIQEYLQYLEAQGVLETRNAGRNGLEARKVK